MELRRGMKLIAFTFLFVALVGLVSAACPGGNPDDVIFRLSNTTNAHVALYNDTSYTTEVCYSTSFGLPAPTSPNRTCFWNYATILPISNWTNAHAGDPVTTASGYNTSICYNGLFCFLEYDITRPLVCGYNSMGAVIARLSNRTNAHVENASMTNYDYSLCCMTSIDLLWLNSSGHQIITARIGDTVYPTLTNTPGGPGRWLTIIEQDGGTYNTIRANLTTQTAGQNANYTWTITMADILAAGGSNDNNPFEFNFFAFQGSINTNKLDVRFCGDGTHDSSDGEECDRGTSNTNIPCTGPCDYCNTTCSKIVIGSGSLCGDGVVDPGEVCDCGDISTGTNHTNSATAADECKLGMGNNDTCYDWGSGNCSNCLKTTISKCQVSTTDFSKVYWINAMGWKIPDAVVGARIGLHYPGGAGYLGIFEIWEDDSFVDDYITTISGSDDGLDHTASWVTNMTYYELGLANGIFDDELSDDKTEYKFLVDGIWVESDDYLNLYKESVDIPPPGPGGPPPGPGGPGDDDTDITFLSPNCGDEIEIEDYVWVNFTIVDVDDFIKYNVTITEKGVGETIIDQSSDWEQGGSFSVQWQFNVSGTTNIRVNAISEKGSKKSRVSNLIVKNMSEQKNYIAACIDSPENYENFDDDFAFFNASSSKAIAAGPTENSTKPKTSMKFIWAFSDNTYYSGVPTAASIKPYNFTKYFLKKGGNWADLRIELV